MRRLVVCFVALITLAACGGDTTSDPTPADTTEATTNDTSESGDVEASTDVTTSEDTTTAPDTTPDVTDPPTGCQSDADCDDGDPCTINSCDTTSGECTTTAIEGCPADTACGDGICIEEEGEDADNCPEDCCPANTVKSCDKSECVDDEKLDNGVCDPEFDCEDWDYDFGDCVEALCGDGLCEGDEDATNCEADCSGDTNCGDGICSKESGEAHENCPEDCCPDGEVKDCEKVSCIDDEKLEDGTCDALLNCAAWDYDMGDCDPPVCGDGLCEGDEATQGCVEDCGGSECGDAVCDMGEGPAVVGELAASCMATCDNDEACTVECIAADLDLSIECAQCFGAVTSCVAQSPCLTLCTETGPESDACTACIEDEGCTAGLAACQEASCTSVEMSAWEGTCPEDCVQESTCGDGVCDPGEKAPDVGAISFQCGETCEGDLDCGTTCIAEDLGVSSGCAGCYATTMTCIYASCFSECNEEGAESEACLACGVDNGCMGPSMELCLSTNCGDEDIAQMSGSCEQDCESPTADTCGDGVCDAGEAGVEVSAIGVQCAAQCGADAACITTCISEDIPLSTPCVDCFAPVVTCLAANCLIPCEAAGGESEECNTCLQDNGCDGEVEACLPDACNMSDFALLAGTCNQDCEEVPNTDVCGDGTCSKDEEATDPLSEAALCATECANSADCTTDCLMTETGLSKDCATCSSASILCIFDGCYDACVNPDTENDDACDACALEQGCGGEEYVACLTNECTQADSEALASSCPEDCGDDGCLAGQVLDCEGLCSDADAIGDSACDEALNCAAWGFDGGDCVSAVCGDQICDAGEEATCPSDCTACDEGLLPDCSGGCSSASDYGNGTCDTYFDCEPLSFDGGDCDAICGDGLCAAGEGPTDMGPLAGQCAAGCTNDPDCTQSCIADFGFTGGCSHCFADAAICVAETCFDACYVNDDQAACDLCAAGCYGDEFNGCLSMECANEDDNKAMNGSCAFDCGECPDGEVDDCLGGCTPAGWLGDETCQPELDCDALHLDMGDCAGTCGNDTCDEGEGPTDVMGMTFFCSTTCGPDTSCITDCLIDSTGVSFECAGCHSGFFSCMADNCTADCSEGEDDAGCGLCLEEAGCMNAVSTCVPVDCASDADQAIVSGTCPGDCLECPEGQVIDCMNQCSTGYGDGECDDWMNCEETDWDGGDCECADDEIFSCDGSACVTATKLANDTCDAYLDCVAYEYDGGDCDTCGNGWCGPEENNFTCPDDCTEPLCEEGKIPTCDSECVNSEDQEYWGDGECDLEFACEAYNYDEGDCCPEGQGKDCYDNCAPTDGYGDAVCNAAFDCEAWDYDGGDCSWCGDNECNEDPASCPEDCGPPSCEDNQVLGCDWECYPAEWLEDDVCDEELDCADTGWDNDACCPDDFIKDCNGECKWEAYHYDEGCDPYFDCVEMDQDNGSCAECGDGICNQLAENPTLCEEDCAPDGSDCGEGFLDDCLGGCSPEVLLTTDLSCNVEFACQAWDWDGGACCPDDKKPTCEGGCMDAEHYGDDHCDPEFSCAELGWDGGDCDACPEGEISTCDGQCTPAFLLGGDCDQALNCEALGWDAGACLGSYCGDEACDDDEAYATCPQDCTPTCNEGEIPGCWAGCVDETLLGDEACDSALSCPVHNFDGGDCGYCGDFVCDAETENATLCPNDCGDSMCANDEIDGCSPGVCVSADALSDGLCDPELSCSAWELDGGDCCEDPEQEKICGDVCAHPAWQYDGECDPELNCEAGDFDGGDCDTCGDAECGGSENSWSCPEDCTEVVCDEGEVENCDGVCVDNEDFGDGLCDEQFACGALNWDGGDCCAPNEIIGCDGSCVWEGYLNDGTCDDALNCDTHEDDGGDCCPEGYVTDCDGECGLVTSLGDGLCDPAFECADASWDEGDCCPPGFIKDCDDVCADASIWGDDICDVAFACDALDWDGGACCPEGTIQDCEGACSDESLLGDGVCDEALSCADKDWDGGDCCEDDFIPTCYQAEGEPTSCGWVEDLGNGYCDPDFDCEAYDYDDGDCLNCGDGFCADGGEDETTCPEDCGPKPGDSCDPGDGSAGQVDCSGGCYTGETSEACDEAFNCPEADWDWGECFDSLPKLVINEIDVRSEPGSETEFIELYNPTDEMVSLGGYGLDLFSVLDGYSYLDIANSYAFVMSEDGMEGMFAGVTALAPGEFLVIGLSETLQALSMGTAMIDLPTSPDNNDDGAVILTLGGGAVDSVAWSDDEDIAVHGEGTPVAADTIENSLSRCPDGADTGDNLSDFSSSLPTPGGANFCQ